MKYSKLSSENGINLLRIFLFSMIWAACCLVGLPVMIYVAPDVEAVIWPPITDQRITEPHLSANGDFLLWRWSFHKNRWALPEFISFMAYVPERPRERIPVEVFTDWECRRNFRSDRTAIAGDSVTRDMCARLPVQFQGKANVRIDGFAQYQVTHPFYTVPVRIPATPDAWGEAP